MKKRTFRLYPYIIGRNTKAWRLQELTKFLGVTFWTDFLREENGAPVDITDDSLAYESPGDYLTLREAKEIVEHLHGVLQHSNGELVCS